MSRCQRQASPGLCLGIRSRANSRTRSTVPDHEGPVAQIFLARKARTGNEMNFNIIHLFRVGIRTTRQADGNGAAQGRPFVLLRHRSNAVRVNWPLPAERVRSRRADARRAMFAGPSSMIEFQVRDRSTNRPWRAIGRADRGVDSSSPAVVCSTCSSLPARSARWDERGGLALGPASLAHPTRPVERDLLESVCCREGSASWVAIHHCFHCCDHRMCRRPRGRIRFADFSVKLKGPPMRRVKFSCLAE